MYGRKIPSVDRGERLVAKNRILIVEDEPAVRFGIRDFLELQGYEIDEAETCQDARHLFGNSRPDVVIADYMLPDGTALDSASSFERD